MIELINKYLYIQFMAGCDCSKHIIQNDKKLWCMPSKQNNNKNSNYFKAIVSFLLSSSIKIETLYCFISLAKSEQSKPLYKTKSSLFSQIF